MILRVWGFPLCVVVTIAAAAVAGPASLVMAPLLIWTAVLYAKCTLDSIRNKDRGEP